jgi:hypothetical protein
MLMFDKEVLKPFIESINNYGTHNAFCINERFYTYKELAETISQNTHNTSKGENCR